MNKTKKNQKAKETKETKETKEIKKPKINIEKIAPIATLICSVIIILFQFIAINVTEGKVVFMTQFPLHFSIDGSILTLFEAIIALLIPIFLASLSILLIVEAYRGAKRPERRSLYLKIVLVPLFLTVINTLGMSFYLYLYEGKFSLEYNWMEFVVSLLILVCYLLTIMGKLKSKLFFIALVVFFMGVELFRLLLPDLSPAYAVGVSVYVSSFASVLFGYGVYIFFVLLAPGKKPKQTLAEHDQDQS